MFSMEITRLIERCKQGDADALGELYKAYAQQMKGVCRRYVSDEQSINDILHDAFVIIFTSFDKLRDDNKAEAWMMSITRNVASKYKDHLKTLPMVSLEEASETEFYVNEDGEHDVKGMPLTDVVRMIDNLPNGYSQVFRLSVFEGMTHKEIAAMLGIEPHSSSSQLARAKKMLRKMMQQYWAATLLLLLVPITFFLLKKEGTAIKDEMPIAVNQKDRPKESPKGSLTGDDGEHQSLPQEPIIFQQLVHSSDSLQSLIAQTVDSAVSDTLSNMIAQEQTISDSTAADTTNIIRDVKTPHYDIADLFHYKTVNRSSYRQKWSVNVAYAGGFSEHNSNRPYGFTEIPMIGSTGDPLSPVTFKNWSNYAAYLSELPDDGSTPFRSVIMNIALNNANGTDEIFRKSHHYIPINLSLTLKYRLNNRFGIETGLSYSCLKSEFEMGSNGNTINEQQTIHFLGIPVKGICNLYTGKSWSLYGSLGVTSEIPVYSPLNTSYYLHGRLEATDKATLRVPWQWSVGTGLGFQYNVAPCISIFAEPSLQYYIPTGSNIETYRTEHPFTFSLPLGIRYTW